METTVASSVVSAITAVFTAIGQWLVSSITAMEAVFWSSGALTFVGTLAVVGLAIAVILMVLAMIRSYLQLRA